MVECKVEMPANAITHSMLNAGANPEQVMEQIKAKLSSE